MKKKSKKNFTSQIYKNKNDIKKNLRCYEGDNWKI